MIESATSDLPIPADVVRRAEVLTAEHIGRTGMYPRTHPLSGSNSERQGVGLPGHCWACAIVGHVEAHPDYGCGDVRCNVDH